VASRVIGVDLGTTQIRAAEVELTGKPGAPVLGTVHGFGAIGVPNGAIADGEVIEVQTVASLLKQLWGRAKFSHKNVVIGIGNPRTVVREMEVPALPMQQLRTSLPFQVAEILPMPTDEALLDFYPTAYRAEEGREFLRGILVAVAKATASNAILAVETAGLRPVGVDLSAFAVHRAQMSQEWSQQVVAFVEIGARVTTVVVASQGQPRLIRLLPSGGQDATDAVASAMQIPAVEAEQFKRAVGIGTEVAPQQQLARDAVTQSTRQLVEGIRNTFVYFSGNNPGQAIQHVVLTGGGAYLPGLGQYLASASRLPVSFGNGLARVKVQKRAGAALAGQELLATTAVGLALAEVQQ
jgi:type IV pilus assembly protein PilM